MQTANRGFAALDLNHDGVISRKEWSVMQARMVAAVPQRGRVQLMCATNEEFRLMDRNYDGKIALAEWTADNFGKDRQPITGCY
jgi:Ca2+-binding EF-hand superfamily protein